MNTVILIGNAVRDPECRQAGEWLICKCGLAVNEKRKGRDGQTKEDVCFIDLTIWGKSGEAFAAQVRKGQSVFVAGKLKQETWTTQDGQKRSKHSVTVDTWMIDGRAAQSAAASAPSITTPAIEAINDDMPF